MNKYIVSGRLVKDVTVKEAKVGNDTKKVASSTLAVKKYNSDETEFIDLTAWNNTADFMARNYIKGDGVVVIGIPSAKAYQTKDGEIKAQLTISVSEIERTTPKQNKPTEEKEQPKEPGQTKLTPISDSDLPF